MKERLIFTNTRLQLSGKRGILREDSEGYYEFPIGAFNCMNSAGEVYTDDNIKEIYSSSSSFMQKVNSGKLYGEYGHPIPLPGETPDDYMLRASSINDKDTCVLFKEIWNDPKAGKHFTQYPGITEDTIITFGRLKPHGNKWEALDRAIKDPNCNIAFSVRNIGRDRTYRGVTYVSVEKIITYDAVGHQGVASSEKYASLRLEHQRTVLTPTLLEKMRNGLKTGSVRLENADLVRSILETGDRFYAHQRSNKGNNPSYFGWV